MDRQSKNGRTAAGSQRYWGRRCGRKYTPEPKAQGYPPEVRRQALRMYVDGGNLRRSGRTRGVVHQTVANGVTAASAALPDAPPVPDRVESAERDELYTFVTDKQTVPRSSRRSSAPRAASWAGTSSGSGRSRGCRTSSSEARRPASTTPLPSHPTHGWSTILASTPSPLGRARRTPSRRRMPHCATTWPASPASRGASRGPSPPCAAPSSSSSTPGTAARCIGAPIRPMRARSWIS
jgi:transposase-like protein